MADRPYPGRAIHAEPARRSGPAGERAVLVLPAARLEAALAFYARLGFAAARVYGPPDNYAILRRGETELHLYELPDVDPAANYAGCYLRVGDADAVRSAWAKVLSELPPVTLQPYGQREFHLTDPSGNLLRVGSPVPAEPRRLRVTAAHTRTYDDPIAGETGDAVSVGGPDADEPEWFWCRGPDGREGWVHRRFFVPDGAGHRLIADYDAAELTVAEGDLLLELDEAGGWRRCEAADGRIGWVRASCVEPA